MEQSKQNLLNIRKGFSLFEVVIALAILSSSLMVLYNLILSTSSSIYDLEDHYLAKEVANNRISLINTIEKPKNPISRNGKMKMGANIFKGIFLKLIDSYQQRRQLSYGVSSNSNPSKKIETTSQSLSR